MNKCLTLLHLYPDLLNLYGDKGNILALQKRMQWRGYDLNAEEIHYGDEIDFKKADIILLGGGSDQSMKTALSLLQNYKNEINDYIENGGVFLAFCGGFHMLGKYFYLKDEKTDGLDILEICTEKTDKRIIGNCVIESNFTGEIIKIAGFENHGAKTDIGDYQPFGRVLKGQGNFVTGNEGIVYKNLLCTHLHGPLLPKNPQISDEILKRALNKKYGDDTELSALDDTIENNALNFALQL